MTFLFIMSKHHNQGTQLKRPRALDEGFQLSTTSNPWTVDERKEKKPTGKGGKGEWNSAVFVGAVVVAWNRALRAVVVIVGARRSGEPRGSRRRGARGRLEQPTPR